MTAAVSGLRRVQMRPESFTFAPPCGAYRVLTNISRETAKINPIIFEKH
jgi:hypothetical protein